MTNIYLLADDSDPVAKAVESLYTDSVSFQRLSTNEFHDVEFRSDDVLLLSEGVADGNLPASGFIQFLGCRPPMRLLDHSATSGVVVAGISPVIAPRVANRVIGFTGPLSVKPLPEWGIVGLGEVGTEVTRKVTANRATAVVAEMRTPRAGVVAELGVRRQSLDLLVSGVDVVSVHVHAGPTASPLLSERELNLMEPEAVLINTSHDSVLDETAVLVALENGTLAGYATDCPGEVVSAANESLISDGKLFITTNPLTNQIGAAQQIAKYVVSNIEVFKAGSGVRGVFDPIDFPSAGDPSFWSSRMSPRQD